MLLLTVKIRIIKKHIETSYKDDGTFKKPMDWIGFRTNWNRKPWFLSTKNGIRVDFILNISEIEPAEPAFLD
jgi:hypothetical protein